MLINFLKKIPGFRTGNSVKMIIAMVGYGIIFLIVISNNGFTTLDNFILAIQKIIMISIPFFILFNVFNIRRFLPKTRNILLNYVFAFFIFVIIANITLTFTNSFLSDDYRQKQAEIAQQYRNQNK